MNGERKGIVMENMLLDLASRIRENSLRPYDLELCSRFFFSYSENVFNYDLLVVLAGSSLNRIQRAVQLYRKKQVLIVISGGAVFKNGEREWERYSRYAISHGVCPSDLIIEGESMNTYENLYNSLKIIKDTEKKFQNIVFISSTQHLFRVSLTLLQVLDHLPIDIQYSFYPAYAKNMRQETFLFSNSSRFEIASELEKVVQYHLTPYLSFLLD